MSKKYTIYAYKHYWPNGGIGEYDIPMPYEKDRRDYVIEATSEHDALVKAEAEYGSGQRVDAGDNRRGDTRATGRDRQHSSLTTTHQATPGSNG